MIYDLKPGDRIHFTFDIDANVIHPCSVSIEELKLVLSKYITAKLHGSKTVQIDVSNI